MAAGARDGERRMIDWDALFGMVNLLALIA
jgi:hypothetical protein